jgi:hypothetical protein
MVRSPNRGLTPSKSASFDILIAPFVHPSKIFVWGRMNLLFGFSELGVHANLSKDAI